MADCDKAGQYRHAIGNDRSAGGKQIGEWCGKGTDRCGQIIQRGCDDAGRRGAPADTCAWLGSDDEGTLQLIASVPEWTYSREWDKFPQQTSAPQRLESGSFYLLKALAKEGRGGENLAVGVTLPDGEELRPMPVQGYLFLE